MMTMTSLNRALLIFVAFVASSTCLAQDEATSKTKSSSEPETVGQSMAGAGHAVKDTAVGVGHAAKDAAVGLGTTVKDTAVTVGRGAKEIAIDVGHAVRDAARNVGEAVRPSSREPAPVSDATPTSTVHKAN